MCQTTKPQIAKAILKWKRENNSKTGGDLPGGPVIKNLPTNTGDTVSILGPRRSHIPQSNKARVPRVCAPQQEKALQWEDWAPQGRAVPTSAARESQWEETKTQWSKNKNKTKPNIKQTK